MRYDYIDYKETWKAMEKLVEKGLVKAIGLSNFNSRQIDDILGIASVKPAVLQVRQMQKKREQVTFWDGFLGRREKVGHKDGCFCSCWVWGGCAVELPLQNGMSCTKNPAWLF